MKIKLDENLPRSLKKILESLGRENLVKRLTGIFSKERVENWESCFVVVSDTKIRVKKP